MNFYARLHTVRKSFPKQFQDSFSVAPDTLPPTGLSGIFMPAGNLVVSQEDGPATGQFGGRALPARRQP
jgi:hypothetical protein